MCKNRTLDLRHSVNRLTSLNEYVVNECLGPDSAMQNQINLKYKFSLLSIFFIIYGQPNPHRLPGTSQLLSKILWTSKRRWGLLFSCYTVSDSSGPHGLQHTRRPCPSLSPWACSNSCPLSRWCHPTISFSVAPFPFCLQSFPASGSFTVSRCFASGGQSTGASVSASILSMNIQGWFPLGLMGLIALQSKTLKNHCLLA